MEDSLRILILSGRDWTHPDSGAPERYLLGQVSRWIAWGHRVTVIACSYPGAAALDRDGALTIQRIGGRYSVAPRVTLRGMRGRLPHADVVLEAMDGMTFLTPIWLRTPRLALVHRLHDDRGGVTDKVAAFLLETAPLRFLYGGTRFLTASESATRAVAELGIARDQIIATPVGVEAPQLSARANLDELRAASLSTVAPPSLRARMAASDTGRAAGLAAALMVNNFMALVFTVVFARLLGESGYGSLGALLAAFTILVVPGSALQAAVAREVSSVAAQDGGNPAAAVWRWLERLLLVFVATLPVAILLREPFATAVGVEQDWAVASILPTGVLWLALCVQRGTLQGLGRYRAVGASIAAEAGARLVLGVVLYAVGLGVTGAFLGTTASIVAMSVALAPSLVRAVGTWRARTATMRFRVLVGRAWAPILAFALIAVLQNIDIVYVKHQASEAAASSYAAASVAAKAVIWVAIGLGLYLLPEAVRRTRAGRDARPVLWRTLGLISLVAVPMVLVYAVAGEPILAAVFGDDLTAAAGALPLLALAMSLLAAGYLGVQYLLALGRWSFVLMLALAAVVELVVLVVVDSGLVGVALVLVAVQVVVAPALFVLVLRSAQAREGLTREAHAR